MKPPKKTLSLVQAGQQIIDEFDQYGEALQIGVDDELGTYGATSAIEKLRKALKGFPKKEKPVYLLTLEITCGEYQFSSSSLHNSGSKKAIRNYQKNFYGGDAYWDGETRYFHGGAIAVKVSGLQKITQAQAQVLRGTGVAV